MEAIGYQGYFSERRVLDLAGLVSPEVVALYRRNAAGAAAFHAVLQEMKPDYLVLRSFEVDENRHFHGGPLFSTNVQRDYFHEHYEEVDRFQAPDPLWGVDGF